MPGTRISHVNEMDLPVERNFSDAPPFPNDVPVAPIERVSYQALLKNKASETERLMRSCYDTGFFYLDLRHAEADSGAPAGDDYLSQARKMFSHAETIFSVPDSEKQALDFAKRGSYYGYKPLGSAVTDARGTRDTNEFYNASKDDVLGQGPREPAPAVLDTARPEMAEFVRQSHAIVLVVLRHLEQGLDWPAGSLTSRHRLANRSGDQVRWVRAPPPDTPETAAKAALGAHTDFGSVTLLHNHLGGLQILPPDCAYTGRGDEPGWLYVRPLPGHCIVNLGDALSKFSGGKLMSGLHRVVRPPGQQADQVRLSLVYFSRPEDDIVLKPLVDESGLYSAAHDNNDGITAKEWILRRALGKRGVADYQDTEGTENVRRPVAVT